MQFFLVLKYKLSWFEVDTVKPQYQTQDIGGLSHTQDSLYLHPCFESKLRNKTLYFKNVSQKTQRIHCTYMQKTFNTLESLYWHEKRTKFQFFLTKKFDLLCRCSFVSFLLEHLRRHGWSSNLTKPFCLSPWWSPKWIRSNDDLMSLFRDQVQESETIQW